jgi:hypothetical protein
MSHPARRANVKPLVHWAIARGYTVRFGERTPNRVTGSMSTPNGPVAFAYDPIARLITLEDGAAVTTAATIAINEYGWEEKSE